MLSQIVKLMTQNNMLNMPAYMSIYKLINQNHIRFPLGMRNNFSTSNFGVNSN